MSTVRWLVPVLVSVPADSKEEAIKATLALNERVEQLGEGAWLAFDPETVRPEPESA